MRKYWFSLSKDAEAPPLLHNTTDAASFPAIFFLSTEKKNLSRKDVSFLTPKAGDTIRHRFLSQPQHLTVHTLPTQFSGDFLKGSIRAAMLVRTAVDQKYFIQ